MKISSSGIVDGAFIITAATGVLYLMGGAKTLAQSSVHKLPRELFQRDVPDNISRGAEGLIQILSSPNVLMSSSFEWKSLLVFLVPLFLIWLISRVILREQNKIYCSVLILILSMWFVFFFHSRSIYIDSYNGKLACLSASTCNGKYIRVKIQFEHTDKSNNIREGYVIGANRNYWALLTQDGIVSIRTPSIKLVSKDIE